MSTFTFSSALPTANDNHIILTKNEGSIFYLPIESDKRINHFLKTISDHSYFLALSSQENKPLTEQAIENIKHPLSQAYESANFILTNSFNTSCAHTPIIDHEIACSPEYKFSLREINIFKDQIVLITLLMTTPDVIKWVKESPAPIHSICLCSKSVTIPFNVWIIPPIEYFTPFSPVK